MVVPFSTPMSLSVAFTWSMQYRWNRGKAVWVGQTGWLGRVHDGSRQGGGIGYRDILWEPPEWQP